MAARPFDLALVAQTNVALYRQMHRLGYDAGALTLSRHAYELACVPFAGHYRACGKPFVCHLVGTASVTALLGARPGVVAAALLHSAYEPALAFGNNSGSARLSPERIRGVLGEEVERCVAEYRDTPWNLDVMPELAREARNAQGRRADVLLLRLANEVDEHLDCTMSYCSDERSKIDAAFDIWIDMAGALGFPALAAALAQCRDERADCAWARAHRTGLSMSYSVLDERSGLIRRLRRHLRRHFG